MNPLEVGHQLLNEYEPPILSDNPDDTRVVMDIDYINISVKVPSYEGHYIDWSLEKIIIDAWQAIEGVEEVELDHYSSDIVYLKIDIDALGTASWGEIKNIIYEKAVNLAVMCQLHKNATEKR